MSVFLGNFKYIIWKLENDEHILGSEYQVALLLCSTSYYLPWMSATISRTQLYLSVFLMGKGLSPQALIHRTPATNLVTDQEEMTFWVHFIVKAILDFHTGKAEGRRNIGRIIEHFLRFKADPNLLFWISESQGGSFLRKLHVEVNGRCLKGPKSEGGLNPGFMFKYSPSGEEEHILKLKSGKVSFRDLIPYLGFENQDIILQLLDKNAGELERGHQRTQSTMINETFSSQESGVRFDLEGEPISESELRNLDEPSIARSSDLRVSNILAKFVVWRYPVTFLIGTHTLLTPVTSNGKPLNLCIVLGAAILVARMV